MPNIGPAEIFVILIVALLVFGPDKLPDIGRQVGRAVREFRKVQATLREEVREVLEPRDTPVPSSPPASAQPPELPPIRDADPHPERDGDDAMPDGDTEPDAATQNATIPQNPVADGQAPETPGPHRSGPDTVG